ncbi:MAG: effector-associated domain EAD1-containing protein, partial [Pyrinomonadaceae bacterium]
MIELLREDETQKQKVKAIQEQAIAYYESFDDPVSRAEEIYHRLVLKQDPDAITARWIEGVNANLYNAVEELEPPQQAFLAARLDTDVPDNVLAQARQSDWEEITARRVKAFLRLGQSEQAVAALEQRAERLPGSPLFILAAQAYEDQKSIEKARNVIDQGLSSPLPETARFDLLVLSAKLNFKLDRRDEAIQNLEEARALAEKINDALRLVDASLEVIALSTSAGHPLRQELLTLIKNLSDEQLGANPTLARKAVQMFGRDDNELLTRAVRLVGFEVASQTQLRSLGRAVAMWDLTLSGETGVESGILARMTRIPIRGEIFDTWKVFMQTASPKLVEDVVSQLLASYEITDPVREALMSILGFESLSEPRDKPEEPASTTSTPADAGAQGPAAPALKLTPSDKQKLIYGLRSAFPSRSDLADMLRYRLGLNLDSISLTDKFDGTLENVVDFAHTRGLLPQIIGAALDSSPGNLTLANFARPFGFTPDAVDDEERIETIVRANPEINIDRWRSTLGEMVGRICQVEFPADTETRAGTGFLIGPNTLLTTHDTVEPIVSGRFNPEQVTLRFDVRILSGAIINAGTVYRLAKEKWLIASSGPASATDTADDPNRLNYALLRLDGVPGREPIGGEKAEPEAPPRGWIHLSDGEELKVADPMLVLDWAPDRGVRLIISQTGVKTNETKECFYYRLDNMPQATGAPCFNSNWQLVALHAGKRAMPRRSKDSLGISVAAIVSSLQSRGISDILGLDSYSATVLRGGRVFLNRQQLRQALKELTSPQGRRILIVNGPPGSGKTYTREYVYDVTFSTPNNRVVYVDLDAGVQGPADLVQAISMQSGHGLGGVPLVADASGSKEALLLVNWLISR